jgi:hypothetical protein
MKKTILFLYLFCLITAFTKAQEIHYGAKAGVNLSNFGGSDATDNAGGVRDATWKTSYHLGGFINAKLSDKLGIQTEIQYSRMGAIDKKYVPETRFKLTYISFPLLAKFYPIDGFHLDGGMQLGLLLIAEKQQDKITEDITDKMNNLDYGFVFGFGYELPGTSISLDTRYYLGASNPVTSQFSSEKFINQNFQISLGYAFH